MNRKPEVGMTVVLNDVGLENIFGSILGLSYMKTLKMKITHIGDNMSVLHYDMWEVGVDNQEINQFAIASFCFDIVDP